MLYIGIDLGTSAVKLLLMDETGAIQKTTSVEYPISYPHPTWSEQNPEDWWDGVCAGLKLLTAGMDPAAIRGISVAGQMHGLVILDAQDRVIRPAILWNDGRSTAETDWLNTCIGTDTLSAYTGNIAFSGFTAPKILWVQKNEPEHFSAIRRIMLPKDYIVFRLCGAFPTDYSDASGMLLLDVAHKCWSREMLDLCGITADQLPRLHNSYDVVGTVLPEVAEAVGLCKTCRVTAGAGDNAASAIGTGTVGANQCNISLGTSGTIFISQDKFSVDPYNSLHSFAHADGGYHLLACMLSAASCNQWWMKDILHTDNYLAEQAGISSLGSNGVFFLPYLMGERSPINDTNARGMFVGLSMDTSRQDMTLAVMEGVSFALRDSFRVAQKLGANLRCSKVTGGGAKSELWKTILANVLNISLECVNVEEGPSLGAAILAAVGCGAYHDVADAADHIVRVTNVVHPTPELAERYAQRYEIFSKFYPAMKDVFGFMNS